MDVCKGTRVAVNLAPFIGSPVRSRQSVPCRVLEVEGGRVQVCAEEPYRRVSMWIPASWIDAPLDESYAGATPRPTRESRAKGVIAGAV